MENNISLESVSDEEVVIRYLKRRFYDAFMQQWSTDVFELRQDESCISVCRKALLSSEEEGVKLSFPERMWKSIVAYASLNVGDVRNLSTDSLQIDVTPTATPTNPSHAGIIASSAGETIIGVPTTPAYYNLQGKLLELALPNIKLKNW